MPLKYEPFVLFALYVESVVHLVRDEWCIIGIRTGS